MASKGMATVLGLLDGAAPDRADEVSAAAAAVLGVDGVTAGVGTGPAGVVLAWGGDTVCADLENQQFTLGEGPGPDVVEGGMPILVPDLAAAAGRWPMFVPAAMAAGVRAVFVFPLRIGAISVGTLLAQRAVPAPLTTARLADALELADAVTIALLHRRAAEDRRADRTPASWSRPSTYRAEVHQATGMISVQLGVSLAEALVRLRARAWGEGRPLAEVAADVVARRLRFEEARR